MTYDVFGGTLNLAQSMDLQGNFHGYRELTYKIIYAYESA